MLRQLRKAIRVPGLPSGPNSIGPSPVATVRRSTGDPPMPRSPSRDLVDRFTGNRAISVTRICCGAGRTAWRSPPSGSQSAGCSSNSSGPHGRSPLTPTANSPTRMPRSTRIARHATIPSPRPPFFSNPFSVLNTHDRWHDLTCTKCHSGAAHHESVKKDLKDETACSTCHHDHQGREHSLVRMDDDHCTKCHKDLPAAHEKGETKFERSITGFAKKNGHPRIQSRSREANRGRPWSKRPSPDSARSSSPAFRRFWA